MRIRADVPAMRGAPAGSYMLTNTRAATNVVLEYDNGGYVTVATDQYRVAPYSGYLIKRSYDDSRVAVDWSGIETYPFYWSGTIVSSAGHRATITREPLTWYQENALTYPIDADLAINLELAYQALLDTLVVAGGKFTVDERGWAFGDPPPTYDASTDSYSGTGILGNVNGIFGVNGGTVEAYLRASDGKIVAAAGKIVMDATAFALYNASNALTAYFVGAAITRNGEALAAGDVLFGDNAALTPNLKVSNGGLVTRTATTQYISLGGNQIQCANDSGVATNFLTATGATGAGQDLDATGFGSGGAPIYTNCVRVTSTGNWTLRSIVTGTDGQWLYLINESAKNMTIANAGAAPAGYSAIRTFDGSSPATTNAGCALFIYNSTNGTWDLMSNRG